MFGRKIISLFLILFAFAFFVTGAMAEEKPHFDGFIKPSSKYVWRGYELSDDSMIVFLDGAVSYKGFAAELWCDFDTDHEPTDEVDDTGNMELWETDLILSYSDSYNLYGKDLSYTIGWLYYDYDSRAIGENQEIYLSLGYDTFLSPCLTVYREVEIGEAYYASLDLSYSFPLEGEVLGQSGCSVDMGCKASYMYDEDGDPDGDGSSYDAFHDGVLWAGLSIPYGKYLTISPTLNYSFALESESEDFMEAASIDGDDSDFFWGEIAFSVSF